MGLFGKSKREQALERENRKLKKENDEYAFNDFINKQRIQELEDLCEEKDSWMDTMMSDGLRHGSSEAGRQMAYKREYKKKNKK